MFLYMDGMGPSGRITNAQLLFMFTVAIVDASQTHRGAMTCRNFSNILIKTVRYLEPYSKLYCTRHAVFVNYHHHTLIVNHWSANGAPPYHICAFGEIWLHRRGSPRKRNQVLINNIFNKF